MLDAYDACCAAAMRADDVSDADAEVICNACDVLWYGMTAADHAALETRTADPHRAARLSAWTVSDEERGAT